MAYDNVIIFGAGASFDAGIPLLNNFVDVMWTFAIVGRSRNGALSKDDRELLNQANEIRVDLERYNTRANFNTRNLEDVLSLLSFEAMAGGKALERYRTWVKAVTRTIELSCFHPDLKISDPREKESIYHLLWHMILGPDSHQNPPAFITFNYDLVLERTLLDYFHYIVDDTFKPKRSSCKVNYFLQPYDFVLNSRQAYYTLPIPNSRPAVQMRYNGIAPEVQFNREDVTADVEIPYLKLHGSLNWSSGAVAIENKPKNLSPSNTPTQVAQDPLILPPVFNKMNSGNINVVWQKALEILRGAKHIIIVGYSLPKTDIYMQYFLKAAVGPNSNLQWILVFDPVLRRNDDSAREIKSRYKECFSPQFSERIIFDPDVPSNINESNKGTLLHFVTCLQFSPQQLLFSR